MTANIANAGAPRTLYDKLWDEHVVHTEEDGTAVLYIDRHLVHEVTSPQAFEGLDLAGRKVWRLSANLAVSDHNVPATRMPSYGKRTCAFQSSSSSSKIG